MSLKSLDLLGPNMQLTIDQKNNFKSSIGGIMTIIIIIIYFGTFIGFGNDIIFKTKPKINFNRIKNLDFPNYFLTDTNFLFTIYDQSTDKLYPDFERMFTIYYDYYDFKGNGTLEVIYKIGLEKCSPEVKKKKKQYFSYDPDSYLCFPKNSSLSLKGLITKGIYTAVRLQVDYCQNNTDILKGPIKTDCLPLEISRRLVSKSRIQMNYLIDNIMVDTSKFDQPFINNVDSDKINTDGNTWSRMTINFKQIKINTDVGFFYPNIESQISSGIDSIKYESFYSPNTTTLFSHRFLFTDWLEVYDRDYIKVQDILAMMGGFINFSILVLRFFIEYITKTQIIDIFNNNYRFSYVNTDDTFKNKFLELQVFFINYRIIMFNLAT
jgi:hypothetical protein